MAIAAKLYSKFPMNAMGGDASGDGPMDILSDDIRITLHTATYVPNQSTNEVKADATNELSTANGYTALGQAIAGKTLVSSGLVTTFDGTDVTWTLTGAITFSIIVVWDNTPATPTDPLILYSDIGSPQTIGAGGGVDFVWQWNNTGTPAIFQLTVS